MKKDEMINSLKLFNEKAEKLMSLSFTKKLQKDKGTSVSFSWERGGPEEINRKGPNEESIEAFVATYRMFFIKRDKISIEHLSGIYAELEIPSELKGKFKKMKEGLDKYMNSGVSGMDIINKGKSLSLTHKKLQDIFIYGGILHMNPKKKKTYDLIMSKWFIPELARDIFVHILLQGLWTIQGIATINRKALAELES